MDRWPGQLPPLRTWGHGKEVGPVVPASCLRLEAGPGGPPRRPGRPRDSHSFPES
jgi:hypothetical protein